MKDDSQEELLKRILEMASEAGDSLGETANKAYISQAVKHLVLPLAMLLKVKPEDLAAAVADQASFEDYHTKFCNAGAKIALELDKKEDEIF